MAASDPTDDRVDDELPRRFSWDGFSLRTPGDWNLAEYSIRPEASWVRMEDDNAVRLEMEWTRSRRPLAVERIRKRFSAVARQLGAAGAETQPVEDLPAGWSAFLYSMPDGRHLLAAFRLDPGNDFFCLLKLHFEAASRRQPPRLMRAIAATFQLNGAGVIPWEVFDVGFRLNREFRLMATAFQAGRQLFIFEWRGRRLHLWFFSLADMVLKTKSMEAWCVEFLGGFKGTPAAQFTVGNGPGIIWSRRRWHYPLGHAEEIARWCFRYAARCVHLPARNQIGLWVLQYRKKSDLDRLHLEFMDGL